jgi:hypothetical protein
MKMMMLPQLIFLYQYIQNGAGEEALGTLVIALMHLNIQAFAQHIDNFNLLQRFDYILHDITPEEEAAIATLLDRQDISFGDWGDQECYSNTNFTKQQLNRIYMCFGFEGLADLQDGSIKIPTGHVNDRGHMCCYSFGPEELFLYLMMRMKTGNDHTIMIKTFGGSTDRWSYAWRFLMYYLDKRYENIIGHQGLLRFVDNFPVFYDSISRKVQRDWIREVNVQNGTYEVIGGLSFLPFDIFAFIDCSIDKICRPFSGPAGDFEGAGRRDVDGIAQRAFYTGYKKIHGIKVETIFLPNGLCTLFGPVSARVHDVTGVLQMSQLNHFLVQIQLGKQHQYQALGDGAYGGNMQCIRSYFRSVAGQPPLTDAQKKCNLAIKRCR